MVERATLADRMARVEPLGSAALGYVVVTIFASGYLQLRAWLGPSDSALGRVLAHALRFFCTFVKVGGCVRFCSRGLWGRVSGARVEFVW